MKFQDGFKQLVRAFNVRELTAEDQAIIDKHKAERELAEKPKIEDEAR